MSKPPLRFIGDSHGQGEPYRRLCEGAENTVHVGDFYGRNARYAPLAGLDPVRHRIVAGNHDVCDPSDPDFFGKVPHYLGDYGPHAVPGVAGKMFYARGAFSIDHVRVNEELSEPQLQAACDLYGLERPDTVVTHDAPQFLSQVVGSKGMLRRFGWEAEPKSRTQRHLETMYNLHQPDLWVFGHYHRRWEGAFGKTRFVCLAVAVSPEDARCYLDLF